MSDLKNCRKCGKVFSSTDGSILCRSCSREEDEVFKPLREYIHHNPGTTVYELSNKFNVSIKRIENYIRMGRLEVV
ncbi:MAG: hypothetical protein N3I35_05265 [Clostridia bacterium]|nr:hypothetical protein [Clostridia bacterium]